MKYEIKTLDQAELMLRREGVVQVNKSQEVVEGKQLLEICGFTASNLTRDLKRQIEKHSFKENYDFMITIDGSHKKRGQRPVLYHFTINAANHVLLAAMTKEGKAARQEAIDLKLEPQPAKPILPTKKELALMVVEAEEERERLAIQIEQDRPKVEFAESMRATENCIDITTTAKRCGVGPNKLHRWLRDKDVLMPNNLPYQRYIDNGKMVVKSFPYRHGSGELRSGQRAVFTPKGFVWIEKKIRKHFGTVSSSRAELEQYCESNRYSVH